MRDYQKLISITKNLDNLDDNSLKAYLSVGLAGEVGEVCNLIKKDLYYTNHSINLEHLRDELGDCLYYLLNLASEYKWDLDSLMAKNSVKVKKIIENKIMYK